MSCITQPLCFFEVFPLFADMIIETEPITNYFISKQKTGDSKFNCAAFVAGIIKGILCSQGLVSLIAYSRCLRVLAHCCTIRIARSRHITAQLKLVVASRSQLQLLSYNLVTRLLLEQTINNSIRMEQNTLKICFQYKCSLFMCRSKPLLSIERTCAKICGENHCGWCH